MRLSKQAILDLFETWLAAWDRHDLDGVMLPLHDEIVFENWNGVTVTGKRNLRRAWTPWFQNHGGFKFTEEDVFVDEQEQKVLFRWCLEWPSTAEPTKGQTEIRRGVDVIHFVEGRIQTKYSYSKTTVQVVVTREPEGSA